MSEINDAAVEAVARALFASDARYPVSAWDEGWHPYDEDEREEYRAKARALLTAALPHLTPAPSASATREDVEDVLVMTRLSDYAGTDMAVIGQTADALLARFNITLKEESR